MPEPAPRKRQKLTASDLLYRAFYGPNPRRKQFDVERMAYLVASLRSAEFFMEHFPKAPNVKTAIALLELAARECRIDGLNLEFGVFSGGSIKILANATGQTVHGFDSFEGLPEDWTHYQRSGRFSREGKLPEGLPANVVLHKGWFDESLPRFVKAHPGPVRLLHIDSDLYSSARTVFDNLHDRIRPGTVIVFNEYFNYPGWEQHEHRAWTEFVAERGVTFDYLGWASSEFALAVRVTGIGGGR